MVVKFYKIYFITKSRDLGHIDNLYFTTYGSITTAQYNIQYKTMEHNKQYELN